jgi:hypothetical protein
MPKLKLHVGMHKTGTSTLQHLLKMAYESGEYDFLYPKNGRFEHWPVAHHQLVEDLKKNDTSSLIAIREEADNSPYQDIIISCEDFSYPEYIFLAHKVINFFKDYDIEIHLTLRNFFEWLQSMYLEHVKRDVSRLLPMEYYRENFRRMNFSTIVRPFLEMACDTHIHIYESNKFVRDLFTTLTGNSVSEYFKIHRWNESLSVPMTFFLREYYLSQRKYNVSSVIHKAWQLENFLGRPPKVNIFTQAEIDLIYQDIKYDFTTIEKHLPKEAFSLTTKPKVNNNNMYFYDINNLSKDMFTTFLSSEFDTLTK